MEVAYLLNNKYRVHEVAKDFKKNSKEITDIQKNMRRLPRTICRCWRTGSSP